MKYVLKKASAIGLLLAMALCIGTPAFAGNDAENETYAEVSYYSSENEIDILRESNTQVNDFFLQLEDANPNLELVGVVVKSMYMEESYDENGIVTECNFLTNKEVEEAINPLSGQSFVGDDYTTRGKLTITLAVYKDGDYYRLMGGSSWSGRDNSNPEGSPAAGRDYIAISWGGGGNLQCLVAPQMYGSYSGDRKSVV